MTEGDAVSWTVFAWVVGGVVCFSAACWAFTWHSGNLLHSRVSRQGQRHDDYREQVAREYVRHEHLQATEARVTDALAGLRGDIKDQTSAVNRLSAKVHRLAGSGRGARSDDPDG